MHLAKFLLFVFVAGVTYGAFEKFFLLDASPFYELTYIVIAYDAIALTIVASLIAVPWRVIQRILGRQKSNTPIYVASLICAAGLIYQLSVVLT